MDEFFDQFFPTEFLIEYLENGPEENMDRFQTYVVYRFLTFAAKENPAVITELRDTLECPLSMDNLSDIYRFLIRIFIFLLLFPRILLIRFFYATPSPSLTTNPVLVLRS